MIRPRFGWPHSVAAAPMHTVYVTATLDAMVDDFAGLAREWCQVDQCPITGVETILVLRRLDPDWYAWLCSKATKAWRQHQAGEVEAVDWSVIRERMRDLRQCVSAAIGTKAADRIRQAPSHYIDCDYRPPQVPQRLAHHLPGAITL